MKAAPPAEGQPQDPAAGLQIYKTEGDRTAANWCAEVHRPAGRTADATGSDRRRRRRSSFCRRRPGRASTTPSKAAPALRPSIPAQPPAPAKPIQIAKAEPPAPKPVAKVEAPTPKPATPQPSATMRATPPAAKPAPPKAPKRLCQPPRRVASPQCRSALSSQALADKGWSDAAALAPGAAAGKGKSVEKIDKDGKTLFRTQLTRLRQPRGGFGVLRQAGRPREGRRTCFVK